MSEQFNTMHRIKSNLNFQLILFLLFIFTLVILFSLVEATCDEISKSIARENLNKDIKINNSEIVTPTIAIDERIIVTGVIRTSGLMVEEKNKLGLNYSNYQITDLKNDNKEDLVVGYFLESINLFSRNYLGKCVKIEGKLLTEWEDVDSGFVVNDQFTYGNLAIIPENIKPQDMTECEPYDFFEQKRNDFELLSFSGVLQYAKRPAPNVSCDYQLILDEEYVDNQNSTGRPLALNQIDVVPGSNKEWLDFEEKIGRRVTLSGYYLWGYSESKYLEVNSIE